ncbi:CpaD family pilus assembly lipoprotein [Vibrio salinus]|uniref:CpaD family pilus assembly lipoprotein n=1 Tax=Vibrio salinus TaxID=2899784 RepID=UPI001E33CDE7|nr:CpaD family pilus assembly lipoprotein [Vibrio salinus]MCE0495913.1 CpaD family pilus assembly protein [Vibrio salinus]
MYLRLIFIFLCIFLTGCEHTVNQLRAGDEEVLTGERYPINVSPSVSAVSLKLTNQEGLDEASFASLNTLLMNQGRLIDQVILIQPFSSDGEQFAFRLKSTLLKAGAKQVKVQPKIYDSGKSQWDLRVQSQAMVVSIPDCQIHDAGQWAISPYEAIGPLGCATRSNLARMVADPRDLIRSKPLDSADAVTSVGAVERYYEDDLKELLDIDFNEDN